MKCKYSVKYYNKIKKPKTEVSWLKSTLFYDERLTGPLLAQRVGDPQMALMTPHLKKLTGTLQCLLFLCNTYHRQPSVRFMERLV